MKNNVEQKVQTDSEKVILYHYANKSVGVGTKPLLEKPNQTHMHSREITHNELAAERVGSLRNTRFDNSVNAF